MKTIIRVLLVLSLLALSCKPKDKVKERPSEAKIEVDRMQWWKDAKFGMFIHWGIYATSGGEWNGQPTPKSAEWMLLRSRIPVRDYMDFSKTFNPINYNPEEWVKLAKEAGMKYIVLTTKHHDGFALFPSKADRFNVEDATPYKKDIIKMYVDACRKYDIKIGFYYSHAIDWTHPGGAYTRPNDTTPFWDESYPRTSFKAYIENKAIPQLKEILSNYGKIDILWWDTPWGEMNEEYAHQFKKVVDSLQPGILTNNRLLKNTEEFQGDFQTPERYIPPTGLAYNWETCMPTNTSWGYKKGDMNWKSEEELLQKLAVTASQGGNLLLNFGPNGKGEIPKEGISILNRYANWMTINKESIYATEASPFHKLFWGVCTQKKIDETTTKLYFHVFDWPENGKLKIQGLDNNIITSYFLDGGENITAKKIDGEWLLEVGYQAKDKINTVIVAEIMGRPQVKKNIPIVSGDAILKVAFADVVNKSYVANAHLDQPNENATLVNLQKVNTKLVWGFQLEKDYAKYKLVPVGNFADTLTWRVDLIDRHFFISKMKNDKFAEFKDKGLKLLTLRPAYNQPEPIELKHVKLIEHQ